MVERMAHGSKTKSIVSTYDTLGHDHETGMLLCFALRHETHTASRRGRPVLEVVGGRTQARAVVGTGVLTHMGLENIFSLVWVSTDFSLR